jgi:hypothetical protein
MDSRFSSSEPTGTRKGPPEDIQPQEQPGAVLRNPRTSGAEAMPPQSTQKSLDMPAAQTAALDNLRNRSASRNGWNVAAESSGASPQPASPANATGLMRIAGPQGVQKDTISKLQRADASVIRVVDPAEGGSYDDYDPQSTSADRLMSPLIVLVFAAVLAFTATVVFLLEGRIRLAFLLFVITVSLCGLVIAFFVILGLVQLSSSLSKSLAQGMRGLSELAPKNAHMHHSSKGQPLAQPKPMPSASWGTQAANATKQTAGDKEASNIEATSERDIGPGGQAHALPPPPPIVAPASFQENEPKDKNDAYPHQQPIWLAANRWTIVGARAC